ncbi:MAG: hypothetical protein EPN82_03840 [Bacteroidetes bacterium]|nr:MAG: hypothetical protein EPN82_03840 [Bacteroidota bacterium]
MKYLTILSFIILIGIISLSFRGESSIIDHPIIEDAYYTFSVAKNLAHGNGVTVDGETLTNGFQPLYTFIIVPAFAVTNNDFVSVRIIFIFLVLIFILSAYLFAVIIRDSFSGSLKIGKQELFWISFLTYMSSTLFFKNQLNGLETGLIFLFLLILIRYYQKIEIFNFKNIIILGIIQGLLVLTRIDAVFLVILFFTYLLFKKEIILKKRFTFAIISGLIAIVISSPWWWYNYNYFNSIMPTSGQAQFGFEINFLRFLNTLSAISQNLVPDTYTFDRFIPGGFVGILFRLVIFGFIIIILKLKLPGSIKKLKENVNFNKRTLEILYITLLYSILLALYYLLFSSATHFYHRYLCPLTLIGQLFTVIFISYLFVNKKLYFYPITIVITLAILMISVTMHSGKLMNKSQFYKYQLPLVTKYVPSNEIASSTQSGTLGFFRNKVLNLDGKVNNEVLKYKNNIPEYLAMKKVSWFCDWKSFADIYLGKNPEKIGWVIVARYGDFYLYHKQP